MAPLSTADQTDDQKGLAQEDEDDNGSDTTGSEGNASPKADVKAKACVKPGIGKKNVVLNCKKRESNSPKKLGAANLVKKAKSTMTQAAAKSKTAATKRDSKSTKPITVDDSSPVHIELSDSEHEDDPGVICVSDATPSPAKKRKPTTVKNASSPSLASKKRKTTKQQEEAASKSSSKCYQEWDDYMDYFLWETPPKSTEKKTSNNKSSKPSTTSSHSNKKAVAPPGKELESGKKLQDSKDNITTTMQSGSTQSPKPTVVLECASGVTTRRGTQSPGLKPPTVASPGSEAVSSRGTRTGGSGGTVKSEKTDSKTTGEGKRAKGMIGYT